MTDEKDKRAHMSNAELYDTISNTHDVRVMFDNEIYSNADFAREHNEIRKTWGV